MSTFTQNISETLKFDYDTYKRLIGYLKPFNKRFMIGSLASVPVTGLEALTVFLLGPFIDYINKTKNFDILLWIPLGLVIIRIIQGLFTYVSSYYTGYVSNSISNTFRIELFDKLIEQDVGYYTRHSSGDMVSRYFNDPVRLQQAVVNNLQDFVKEFFSFIFLAAVLIYLNAMYALIAIGIIGLIALPLAIISKKIRNLDHDTQKSSAELIGTFYDLIMGIKVIKVYNLTNYEKKRYRKLVEKFFSQSMRILKASIFLKPIIQIVASIGIGVVLWLGTYEMIEGRMTIGELTSFVVALVALYKPIKTLSGILSKVQRILAPAERVFEKLDEEIRFKEAQIAVTIEEFESLEFKNVWFEYVAGEPVLKNINLIVNQGETLALIGQSGGGKTTLVNLIPRFIEATEGEVLINGHNIQNIKFKNLYKQLGIVTQEPFLIAESLKENIRIGKLDATDEEIEAAAEAAHVMEFAKDLPDGLDSYIGERGGLLSGGQRQRVTIARAFLKNPPLLILDEATSALDNETERLIQDSIDKLRQNRTVIVIAHRLSTITHADRIMVIENGIVMESGSHHELMNEKGIYKKLYELQFANV